MSTTANDVFLIGMAIADEMTDTINVVNASDTASYEARTPGILTLLQAELVRQGDLYKTFEVSGKPVDNILGNGFDYQAYIGTDINVVGNGSCRAYSFEVDGEATVYIEDFTTVWNVIATISATDPTTRQFTAYKGVVVPSSGATASRIRFSGTYAYTFTNYALFTAPMKLARIPDYAPWVKVSMPADFKSLDQVVNESEIKQYLKDTDYKWEGHKDLYVRYDFEGSVRINYRPIPAVVTGSTDVLELDDVTCRTLLPYGLAAELFKEENKDVSVFCKNRYAELKANSVLRKPASEQVITDVYGGW